MIRPICITILYHKLPLFIDICLIMRYYLWLFICLCMFLSWRMDCRSLDESWRMDCRRFGAISRRSEKYQKIWKHIILPEDEGSQKEGRSGASGGPHPLGTGPPDPRLGQVWPTCPASDSAHSPISYLRNPNTRGATT